MPSSTINLLRKKANGGEYFRVDDILRSPKDAQKAIKFYDACCDVSKKELDKLDERMMLFYGYIRYKPTPITKKSIKVQRAKLNREKKKNAKACC